MTSVVKTSNQSSVISDDCPKEILDAIALPLKHASHPPDTAKAPSQVPLPFKSNLQKILMLIRWAMILTAPVAAAGAGQEMFNAKNDEGAGQSAPD